MRLIAFLLMISSASLAGASNNDFLDIIIDDTHAYAYLNCRSSNGGRQYSVYSSLMPKDEATHEGVEDFPKILQLLFEAGDFVSESTTGISLTEMNNTVKNGNVHLDFTFRDLMDACRFGFCYMISDYLETAVEGEIVTDQPDVQEVRLRKRFYLTRNQAKRAMALINQLSRESSEGKIVYDRLNHNCVDYVKEIYEGIGLDKTQGEFLSQFGLDPDSPIFDDEENLDNSACMILKAYKIHNDGDIGFQKVLSVIWNAVRCCLSA